MVNYIITELKINPQGRLPREEKLEWAKLCGTMEGDTKFEKFSHFLKIRNSIMENMESMTYILGGGTDTCGYCSKPYHQEDKCRAKHRDQSDGQSVRKRFDGCAICGSDEHWKNECPDRGTSRDRKSGGGRVGNINSTRVRGGDGDGGSGRVGEGDGVAALVTVFSTVQFSTSSL